MRQGAAQPALQQQRRGSASPEEQPLRQSQLLKLWGVRARRCQCYEPCVLSQPLMQQWQQGDCVHELAQ